MRRECLSFACAIALVGCAAGYDVRVDSDPEVDFSGYRSFAIPPRTDADTPDVLDNSLVRRRIEGMIAKQLAGRGLVPAATEDPPDLTVRYWISSELKTEYSTVPASPFVVGAATYPYPYPAPYPYWGGRWGPMYQEVIVRDYTEGTLVLDLIDRKRDQLVWRAYVVGTLSRERERMYERVDEALARAFADFPPGSRKALHRR